MGSGGRDPQDLKKLRYQVQEGAKPTRGFWVVLQVLFPVQCSCPS